jgi:predicted peptidase
MVLFLGIFTSLFSKVLPKPKIKCKYLLYLPVNYKDTTADFPLIIYLHGSSLRGNNLEKLKRYGLPFLVKKGHNYDFIIASPQCPANKSWAFINWFDTLYSDLCSKYRIDKNRVYVIGMSLGGYGTWQAAMDYPDKIAAIIPLCGGCVDSLNICRISNIPVWAFHGTADKAVNVNETEKLVRRLQNCHGKIKYTRLLNQGHDLSSIFANQELYDWLKKQNKEKQYISNR